MPRLGKGDNQRLGPASLTNLTDELCKSNRGRRLQLASLAAPKSILSYSATGRMSVRAHRDAFAITANVRFRSKQTFFLERLSRAGNAKR